ncbi:uncharacterized protein G2W53_039888 [Senna tora]|uniref:Uncharacterized protein n=1 Tax=Senna tora TaxID=362788 RepID=A0A834W355_9FABA|nr:uncharacterized protein G2W53_039888 [Senna tora]
MGERLGYGLVLGWGRREEEGERGRKGRGSGLEWRGSRWLPWRCEAMVMEVWVVEEEMVWFGEREN